MTKTILIADDEPEIINVLTLFLEAEGFKVAAACNGKEALTFVQKGGIDMAIVDIMMPSMDGFQLIKLIRAQHKFPIIILSAKNQETDKIVGLGIGADDFICKPFSAMEVLARVQAHLRRTYEFNEATSLSDISQIRVGNMTLDHHSCMLYKREQPISLSSIEYKLLDLFMKFPGRVYTKKQIFEHAWSEHYFADDNTIMVQISRLRDKIEDHPKNPMYIKTIRGLGYRFAKKDELDEK
ncbi:response regulator transcription factor [Paenibacillus sp. GSMTC-2017]|uniref:response regulator transcription factor n=1 Tax=Paenibacillus sp. GSMTC-2017 TaxID=2794350 RepID=UPI0018D74B80|nr:response regulator transcription factor [Paenibacillus sp. GSMTC-2017]MBH5316816.1 response regulator transcription factor [Paenibacillus sp. GSMTC-2017]